MNLILEYIHLIIYPHNYVHCKWLNMVAGMLLNCITVGTVSLRRSSVHWLMGVANGCGYLLVKLSPSNVLSCALWTHWLMGVANGCGYLLVKLVICITFKCIVLCTVDSLINGCGHLQVQKLFVSPSNVALRRCTQNRWASRFNGCGHLQVDGIQKLFVSPSNVLCIVLCTQKMHSDGHADIMGVVTFNGCGYLLGDAFVFSSGYVEVYE
jgi:hypothetical protein